MSKKDAKIAALVGGLQGRELDAHYLGYFECFNRGWFFEAHDVLEALWLADRQSPNYSFYKGLIQLAGAFVHLRKQRLRPAAALFGLAEENLRRYPAVHERLEVSSVLAMIGDWKRVLEQGDGTRNPLLERGPPRLDLLDP